MSLRRLGLWIVLGALFWGGARAQQTLQGIVVGVEGRDAFLDTGRSDGLSNGYTEGSLYRVNTSGGMVLGSEVIGSFIVASVGDVGTSIVTTMRPGQRLVREDIAVFAEPRSYGTVVYTTDLNDILVARDGAILEGEVLALSPQSVQIYNGFEVRDIPLNHIFQLSLAKLYDYQGRVASLGISEGRWYFGGQSFDASYVTALSKTAEDNGELQMVLNAPPLPSVLATSDVIDNPLSQGNNSDVILLKDGRRFQGSIYDLNAHLVRIRTQLGSFNLAPNTIETLNSSRTWQVAQAGGATVQGQLEVVAGVWYFNEQVINLPQVSVQIYR